MRKSKENKGEKIERKLEEVIKKVAQESRKTVSRK